MQNKSMIQELPTEERPYEKCLRCGPSVLSDSELLAVIIRSGTQGSSSIDLARKVLEKGTLQKGLLGIHHLSLQELMEIKGIGQVKAVQIKCIGRSIQTNRFCFRPGIFWISNIRKRLPLIIWNRCAIRNRNGCSA